MLGCGESSSSLSERVLAMVFVVVVVLALVLVDELRGSESETKMKFEFSDIVVEAKRFEAETFPQRSRNSPRPEETSLSSPMTTHGTTLELATLAFASQ